LELESGYSYETSRVIAFRRSVIEGDWNNVEKGLIALGVSNSDALRVRGLHVNDVLVVIFKRARRLLAF
jgi:hypothetical protein